MALQFMTDFKIDAYDAAESFIERRFPWEYGVICFCAGFLLSDSIPALARLIWRIIK